MQKKTIAILSTASIAQRSVIPALMQLPQLFNVVACASRDIQKATAMAHQFNIKPIGAYQELIDDPSIEALYIPLPTGLHKEWINKALKSGKHVYAEKSIAMCHADALEMVNNARSNNLALMEGYMFQYHAQHQHLRQLVDSGLIGELRHFSASFGFPPLPADNFRYDPLIGGGVLTDAAGYPLRAAHMILGDQLKVTGATLSFSEAHQSDLFGSAYLSGSNGIGAAIVFGFDNFYQCQYQLWGSKGKITANRAYTPKADEVPTFLFESQGRSEVIPSHADNHFIKAMIEFHNLITDGDKEKHYQQILTQSHELETIKQLA